MSKQAFPGNSTYVGLQGMTYHEWLVGMALQGMVSSRSQGDNIWILADTAIRIADETIKQLGEGDWE